METGSTTRFVACPNCGRHGFIILKDGRRSSKEFGAKPQALAEVDRILSMELIDEYEANILRTEIAKSDLAQESVMSEEDTVSPILGIAIAVSLSSILAAIFSDEEPEMTEAELRRQKAHLN